MSVLLPEFERLSLKKLKWLDEAAKSSEEIIQSTNEIVKSVTKSLINSKIPESIVDDIIIRAMYVDDVIGNNQMLKMIDDLAKNPNFKNPADMIKWLDESVIKSNGSIVSKGESAKDLLNELATGLKELNGGNEVIISKIVGGDEIDVLNITSKKIIECKRVNSGNYQNVEERLNDIVKKFTVETKLSEANKSLYLNHEGQLFIDNVSNPYYNMSKQEFINALKNGDGLPSGTFPKIGNDVGQISIDNIKKIQKLTIKNGKGEFIITKDMW